MSIITRKCNKCQQVKPLTTEFFSPDKTKSSGMRYTCRKCSNTTNKKRYKLPGSRKRDYEILKSSKNFDSKKGYTTDLNLNYINLSLASPCTYCGFPSTGLDRIDNKKGHTIANSVPCCRECNVARMDNFTHEEMKLIGIGIRAVKLKRLNESKNTNTI